MEVQQFKLSFEKMIFFKGIPYWLYWPAVGVLIFILGGLLTWVVAEKSFFCNRVFFSGAFGTLPCVNIWLFHSFKKTMQELSPFFFDNNTDFERWYKCKEKYIFTLNSWQAKFIIGCVLITGLITIILSGIPFNSSICKIVGLILFTIFLILCGNTFYISISLLSILGEIVKIPAKIPFFMIQHPVIYELQNFYLIQALVIFFYYICLVIAIWQGPYGFNNTMLIWSTGLAIYQFAMFSWIFYQLHYILKKIKYSHITIINSELQSALEKIKQKDYTFKDIEKLEKIMDVQNKIHTLGEWPRSYSGVLTFFTTLATAVTQILLSTYFK